MRFVRVLFWLALLVAPLLASLQLLRAVAPWIMAAAILGINLLTYIAYAADKRRAERGEWRIAESVLHGLEFFGGWPAALLGQHRLRHKSRKRSYQVVFWLIVLIHEYLAVDYLNDWRILQLLGETVNRH